VRGTHDVTADFTGPNVTVDQVDPLPTLWAGIKATSNAADLMPTIAPIDGTASSVSIVFGRTSTLAQILATAVKTPVDLQSNAAQIVLSFASAATSTPISGVQIASLNGASTSFGALIYDFDTTYSDQQGATAGRGTAVIANAATTASSPFPGDKAHVAYSFPVKTSSGTMGTSLQNVDVYVSPGALTIARVLINQ
jgi:hypothetical protein